jgi:hypothetical protein
MKGSLHCAWLLTVLLSALRPGPVSAQATWGSLQGFVTDLTGAVIPGAQVLASSSNHPRGLTTTTSEIGFYHFSALPLGRYTITVAAPGFHTLRYHNLNVRLGTPLTFDARLSLGSVMESIEVNESLPAIRSRSSSTSTHITASEFDNVARGRSFHTILMMAPGVRHEIKAGSNGVGGVSVDGASGSENAYFIDGVEVSDLLTGALRPQDSIPFEFVRELQIKSGGFEAEFGGATGGVIHVATRGGSEAWHGELLLQATSSPWNAGDRGFYQRSPNDANSAEFLRPRKDDYSIWYPGFSLGGPLLRNRIFGFASYMPEFESSRRNIDYASGTQTFYSDKVRHYGMGRLDVSPRSDVQLNTSWVWSPARRAGSLPVRDARIGPPRNDVSSLGEFVPSQAYSLAASYSVNSRLLFSARYGYKYLNNRTDNYGLNNSPYITYRTPSASAPEIPDEFDGVAGFESRTAPFVTHRNITSRHNLYLDTSRVSMIAGQQHILKAGYALNRVMNDVADGYPNGRFEIFWGETFSRGSTIGERGRYGYYIWEDGLRHNGKVSGRNHGLYIQDTWRAHPRLTVNAGIRLEREHLPPYQPEVNGVRVADPVDFGWGDKLAPRVGAAWDPLGNGRWKVSASFGLFYDLMKYSLARASFGGEYWMSHVYRMDRPEVSLLSLARPDALGSKITSYNNRSVPINERGELSGIDPNLKPYASREFTVAVDRQITSRLNLGLRYTRKELLRAIEDIGVLNENDTEVYLIGNPGFGLTRDTRSPYGQKTPDGQEFLVPRATRQYDGLELRLEGELVRTHLTASYTFSRLYGNYAGLANSDEAGRMEPSISRSFDLPTYYFDSSGSQRNVEGRLATDRPHVFKLYTWRDFSTRVGTVNVGFTQQAASGGLDSTTVTYLTAPTFPFGRGDLGRMPVFTQTDLNISHTVSLTERFSLKIEATAVNLLNQAAVISRVTQINRAGNITLNELPLDRFFAGYDVRSFVRPGSRAPYNPIYGLAGGDPLDGGVMFHAGKSDLSSAFLATNPGFGAYQGPRSFRLGLRLVF